MHQKNQKLTVGLGLRRQFIEEIAQTKPDQISFFEVHPENYIDRGGLAMDCFE